MSSGRHESLGGQQRGSAALQPLLIAAWCALAAGLLEALRHTVLRFGFGLLTWASDDVSWLAPLSYLALFALPALGLAAIAALRPRLVQPWLPTLVFVTAGSFGLLALLGQQRISYVALALLALGIGVQAARTARARPDTVLRLARRTGVPMAAAVLGLMVVLPLGRPVRERLQLASLPAPPTSAANVLFIILDTVRSENLSLFGYQRPTSPNLERLASEGVAFESAFAPAPWTLPSHASAFTGRWPHELTAGWRSPLDGTHRTLAESFRDRGYRTGAFVANLIYTGREAGLARGFMHYRDHKLSLQQLLLSSQLGQLLESYRLHWLTYYPHTDRKIAPQVAREFLGWVDQRPERPFFAFLNYYDAHQPYFAPWEYRQRFRSGNTGVDSYDASIAYLDAELGKLFAELRARRLLDNTIIVVAADHGDQFGEHGLFEHGNGLYDAVLRVPLIMRYPASIPAGVRVADFVSLRDLPATLAELTGAGAGFPGASLVSLWSGRGSRHAHAELAEVSQGIRPDPSEPVAKGPMQSVFLDPYHYIRNGDGRAELYDLRRDPEELRDLARTARGREEVRRLEGFLKRPPNSATPARAALAQ